MNDPNFDQLLSNYKEAVDRLVDAIRREEALANQNHSMVQMELWDDADFKVQEAAHAAKQERDAYKNALREKNYGF